jgi:hypothetical protein
MDTMTTDRLEGPQFTDRYTEALAKIIEVERALRYRTRPWSGGWYWWKWMLWSSDAPTTLIGTVTRPKVIAPDQIVRGMAHRRYLGMSRLM